jgi:hypothetical protein
MSTDPKNNIEAVIDRILRERLNDFNVPREIQHNIRDEFIQVLARPERTPYGACVMTPEASLAADKAKQRGTASPDDEKPRIV